MPLFWIHCVCLLLLFPLRNSVPYPSSKCYKSDCFYELPDFNNGTCKIYNTSVCLDLYNVEGSFEETSEDESKFFVSVVPYTAELFVHQGTFIRSAINFTFTIDDTDVNELVVKIYTKVSSTPICRIFVFQNVNNSKKFPINLFYDCLFNLVEEKMQNVRMDFTALPVKEKLSYYVFIPGTEYNESCVWQPLIMVFSGSLQNGEVQVKFSQAPELYNVSSYVVKLTENLSGAEKIVDITPDISRIMLFAQFSSVDEGAYTVSVKPVIWGEYDNCEAKTDVFLIEKTKSDHMLTIYLCIFILLLFSALVFLKMFGRNVAKLRFGSKRRILLLYSYDCEEHKDFIIVFIDYLVKYCHVEVSTIYGDECNPQEWTRKKYDDCDIIMFLISAGLFHTLDQKDPRHLRQGHEWRQQLPCATNFILNELRHRTDDIEEKKICKVRFPYSSETPIPDILRAGCGRCYDLPREMNNLMNFIHYSKECFLCSKLCVTNFESSPKSAVLLEKSKAVKKARLQIIEPLSDTTKKDWNDKVVNFDEISTPSDSSDENFVRVENFVSGNLPKPNLNKTFSNLSPSDNICPNKKNEDWIELNTNEPSDSEKSSYSEESGLLCDSLKLHSENEGRCFIENIRITNSEKCLDY